MDESARQSVIAARVGTSEGVGYAGVCVGGDDRRKRKAQPGTIREPRGTCRNGPNNESTIAHRDLLFQNFEIHILWSHDKRDEEIRAISPPGRGPNRQVRHAIRSAIIPALSRHGERTATRTADGFVNSVTGRVTWPLA